MSHALSSASPTPAGRGGLIRTRDPRVRIVIAVLFAVLVVALTLGPALLAALGVSTLMLAASGLPWRETLKRMILMDTFIVFMLVLLPFTVAGEPAFTLWGFTASKQGFAQAAEIALTANAVILALMTLVGTLEPVTLGHALHRLGCPERLVHLLMFTVRYIDVLREESERLRVAMRVRGFRPGTNWHTYRSYGYLVGMMLVRALERSERIMDAMKCRGFDGRLMLLSTFRATRADWGFASGAAAMMLGLVALEISWP